MSSFEEVREKQEREKQEREQMEKVLSEVNALVAAMPGGGEQDQPRRRRRRRNNAAGGAAAELQCERCQRTYQSAYRGRHPLCEKCRREGQ